MDNFRTYDLAVQLYQVCKKLRISPVLRNQLERASSSVALNLAEGQGRCTTADQKHFFSLTLVSVRFYSPSSKKTRYLCRAFLAKNKDIYINKN